MRLIGSFPLPRHWRARALRAVVLGLFAAILSGPSGAESSDAEFQAWLAKPQLNLSKLGVTYWRIAEPWAAQDAVVTIDDELIEYSAPCNGASFPYQQLWRSDGGLEVFPVAESSLCGRLPSNSFLRFYYALRQSGSVKSSDPFALFTRLPEDDEVLVCLRRFVPASLEFRRWIISQYFDSVRLVAPNLSYSDDPHYPGITKTMPPPVITFNRGDLEGSPTCGSLVGEYTLKGRLLKMQAGRSLHGYCPPSADLQNYPILAALRRVRRFEPNGGQMILRGAKGEVEVVLTPA